MRVLKSGYMALVYCFLYLPIAVIIVQSFNAAKYGTSWQGFTLAWYRKALASPILVEAALNSLWVAVLAATLATALGQGHGLLQTVGQHQAVGQAGQVVKMGDSLQLGLVGFERGDVR